VEWQGKSVVVTGGATGIGRYIAVGAAARGADVAVADVDTDGLRDVGAELRAFGHRVVAMHVDVRSEAATKPFLDMVATSFGSIDLLVNNAAIVPHFQWGNPRWPVVRDMDFAFWSNVLATNVHGIFLCSKFVLPYMEKQGGGHIVNVHGSGPVSPPGAMAYAVSKEAGVVFSRYLAEEVREHNICVLSLGPGGPIATERAPAEARGRMRGPDAAGDRYFLAAQAGMELSGHLVDLVDGDLVAVR
jgi:NAD(P)-dependent dehydrogenase (short-subunit alcohol dehydrogenase family)